MTTATLQSGFRRMGMFPINPNVIKRASLGPSAATDNLAHIEGKDMLNKLDVSDICFRSLFWIFVFNSFCFLGCAIVLDNFIFYFVSECTCILSNCSSSSC